jgi:exosortase
VKATAVTVDPPSDERCSKFARTEVFLLGLSFAVLWFVLCRHLSAEWTYNEQYSYGWFVPFFALYLFWLRWERRPGARRRKEKVEGRKQEEVGGQSSEVRSQKSEVRDQQIIAIIIAAIALLILFPIRLFEIANPGWRPLDWLHTTAVAALTLIGVYLAGGKLWLRHFAFPIGFFFVAVPWFSGIEEPIIQGLMRGVAGVVSEFLNLLGVPAQVEGSVIRVNSGLVGVNEACSGVRSLQTSLMIGLLFGELHRLTIARRFALIVATIALALIANVGRAFLLVWLAATRGLAAMEHAHDIAGYGVLLVVFAGAVGIATYLRKKQGGTKVESRRDKVESESQRSDVSLRPLGAYPPACKPYGLETAPAGDQRSEVGDRKSVFLLSNFYFLIPAFAWLLFVEIGAEAWYRLHERNLIPQPQWMVRWPESGLGFHEIHLDEHTRRMLRFDEGRGVIWRDPEMASSAAAFDLLYFFRWRPAHNSALLASLHRPDVCLPATGWRQTADHRVRYYPVASGLTVPFRHFEFVHRIAPEREQFAHAFYCLWEDRVRRIGNFTTEDKEMARGPSEWTRDERMGVVLAGRRHLGQQVMELVMASSEPVSASNAEARFSKMLKDLIIAPNETSAEIGDQKSETGNRK